jgi:nicotinamide-nucleotide amidase
LAFSEAVILLIGDELLEGLVTDVNLAAVASALEGRGVAVLEARVLADSRDAISTAVLGAAGPGRIIVTTGGLGPTDDDVTTSSIASAFSLRLRASPEASSRIREWYARKGMECPGSALKQALVPEGAMVVANPAGVAPGIVLPLESSVVICLPGVPREVEALLHLCLDAAGLPRVEASGTPVLRTWGIPENALCDRIVQASVCGLADLAFLPRPGLVDLKPKRNAGPGVSERLAEILGDAVYAREWKAIEAVAGEELQALNLTLSVAESCTGGLLGGRITSVPGSSGWFLGGVIAYSNYLKRRILGVSGTTLAEEGAVSEAAARAMAAGARALSGSDAAMAITGVAGPDGGSEARPAGTVWIALEGPGFAEAREWRFGGTRQSVREASVACGLGMLISALRRASQ